MGAWDRNHANGKTHADFYVGKYDLDLFSNFTYFLNDDVNGDQFEQKDNRWFAGGEVNRTRDFGEKNSITLGVQSRNDFINGIGLYNTKDTVRLRTVREDDVTQSSVGIFGTGRYQVNPWFRVEPGIRADGLFFFDVNSDNPVNSGNETDGVISPKSSLVFGPWKETEIYANAGMGFHSNDARGVTITEDPVSNLPTDAVDPLVRTYGFELGARTEAFSNIVCTVALFYLHSDFELLYVGDAGTSEAGPATERFGIERSTYWRPTDWLMIDNELTLSEGRLLDVGPDNEIPGSVPLTMNTGITFGRNEGFYGSFRSVFFGARPLVEDGSQDSRQSWQINARVGYRKNDWSSISGSNVASSPLSESPTRWSPHGGRGIGIGPPLPPPPLRSSPRLASIGRWNGVFGDALLRKTDLMSQRTAAG
jgi:hypothetical protein